MSTDQQRGSMLRIHKLCQYAAEVMPLGRYADRTNDAKAQERFAIWLLCHVRTDEALMWIQRAREIDPLGHSAVSNGFILFHARRYDEAVRELRTVEAAYPDHWYLGLALIANGEPDEAIKVLEKALSSDALQW